MHSMQAFILKMDSKNTIFKPNIWEHHDTFDSMKGLSCTSLRLHV